MVDMHELHKEAQPVFSPKLALKQTRRQTARTSQICTINDEKDSEKDALHVLFSSLYISSNPAVLVQSTTWNDPFWRRM